jgi:hypothetical protein
VTWKSTTTGDADPADVLAFESVPTLRRGRATRADGMAAVFTVSGARVLEGRFPK